MSRRLPHPPAPSIAGEEENGGRFASPFPREREPGGEVNPAAHLTDCHLCPHDCGTRRAGARGVCRVGQQAYIASEMLHYGEEEPLRPAHAIFFSGCTATCSFCTAARFAFRPTYGVVVAPEVLAARVLQRQQQGARSLAFIGGDPLPHLPFIIQVRRELGSRLRIPLVLNSNFYVTPVALALMEPVVDLYLPDLKFGPPGPHGDCGAEIGGMPRYWETLTWAIDTLRRAGKALIVRHLLMPGHFDCCTRPVLDWLAERPGLPVSLLTQYVAPAHARGPLALPLPPEDIRRAQELASARHLTLVR